MTTRKFWGCQLRLRRHSRMSCSVGFSSRKRSCRTSCHHSTAAWYWGIADPAAAHRHILSSSPVRAGGVPWTELWHWVLGLLLSCTFHRMGWSQSWTGGDSCLSLPSPPPAQEPVPPMAARFTMPAVQSQGGTAPTHWQPHALRTLSSQPSQLHLTRF